MDWVGENVALPDDLTLQLHLWDGKVWAGRQRETLLHTLPVEGLGVRVPA